MKFSDKLNLVFARLRVRKMRTIVTIFTMSVLFGVVIAAMTIVQGNFDNLERLNQEAYGDNIFFKANYSGGDVEHAEEHIARAAEQFNGKVVGKITHYCSKEQLNIAGLTPYRESSMASIPCDGWMPGQYVDVLDSKLIASLLVAYKGNDDSINVILPVATAGKLQGINQPSRTSTSVTEYIKNVITRSAGYQFSATAQAFSESEVEVVAGSINSSRTISFTIAGLTPSREITTFSSETPTIFSDIMPIENSGSVAHFMVMKPNSTSFQDAYNRQPDDRADYIIAFSNIQDALAWINVNQYQGTVPDVSILDDIVMNAQEFLTTRISNYKKHQSYNKTITEFTIVFTVVSVIIMIGVLSRVIDDEKSSIALYRSIGATTGEIVQIFMLYMLIISLLVILCATIIGIFVSLGVTLIFGGAVTATARSLFLLPNLNLLIMIGFDWRIIFVWLSIIAIAMISLLTMIKKLVSRDIVKDLKR